MREEKKAETSGRILLCSVTNVAVDNILLRLLESGFTSFSRVGSRKKIARKILRFTLGAEKETQSDGEDAQISLHNPLTFSHIYY
jgi:hypothetical protein